MKLLALISITLMFASCSSSQKIEGTPEELDSCTQICASKGMRLYEITEGSSCGCSETPSKRLIQDRN